MFIRLAKHDGENLERGNPPMTLNLTNLVFELVKTPTENEWLEFKKDNADATVIGKDISALANGAALQEKDQAYMLWGIDNTTHALIGTTFSPYDKCKGNQELLSWLRGKLSSNAEFQFEECLIDTRRIVVLIIKAAVQFPVAFQKEPYIRDGSYTKRLAELPALQAQLWDAIRNENFECAPALIEQSEEQVQSKLDISVYFAKLAQKIPQSITEQFEYLKGERILSRQDNGLWTITNFGAILLAKRLSDFPTLIRKEVRVIEYKGSKRTEIARSKTFDQGYAVSIDRLLDYVDTLLPSDEPITGLGARVIKRVYPPAVIRELILNALIHQDLTSSGNCVLVEIFDNRVEITNPGTLLVNRNRIVDFPPKSRNEHLARIMRRMNLCEELGTGWDRVVELCEGALLPAPDIIEYANTATKVILYSHIHFAELTAEQKLWACYLHACLLWLEGKSTTNSSLRDRFGLDKKQVSSASRLLREAVKTGLLKNKDESAGTKSARYVPYWA